MPSCVGWTVHDVVGHVGRVYRSVGEILRDRLQEPPPRHLPAAPPGAAVVDFYEEAHAELVELLSAAGPDERVWTWSGDHRVGFYTRRMANETAVHRWDAESAHGRAAPVDAGLAVDAIDEYLDIVLPFSLRNFERELPVGSLHLHRTDGDGEWLLESRDGTLVVERAHRKGVAAVRAPASDLLLLLWNRRPTGGARGPRRGRGRRRVGPARPVRSSIVDGATSGPQGRAGPGSSTDRARRRQEPRGPNRTASTLDRAP